ncbi:MAG: D-cysteine desulfhydrase family protein, partial [Nitrososphaerales archaeon]
AVTEEAARALKTALRASGILTDPVYSAKALAGLRSLAKEGGLPGEDALIFLHTGGQPALFARSYARQVIEKGGA